MARPDNHDATRSLDVAGDALHVRRVFGEAYEAGGTLIIPVAKVIGGGGTGFGGGSMGGPSAPSEGSGGGGGFGVRAKPVGVYTVRDGQVSWQPSLDLSRVIAGGQIAGVIAITALAWALRRRRRR